MFDYDFLNLTEQTEDIEIVNKYISESDILIESYEIQRYIVEQNTQIFMQLDYGFIEEGAMDNIKYAIQDFIKKFIRFIKKIIDYINGKKDDYKKFLVNVKPDDVKEALRIFESHNDEEALNTITHYVSMSSQRSYIIKNKNLIDHISRNSLISIEINISSEIRNITSLCTALLHTPSDVIEKKINSSDNARKYLEICDKLDNSDFGYVYRNYYFKLGFPSFYIEKINNSDANSFKTIIDNYHEVVSKSTLLPQEYQSRIIEFYNGPYKKILSDTNEDVSKNYLNKVIKDLHNLEKDLDKFIIVKNDINARKLNTIKKILNIAYNLINGYQYISTEYIKVYRFGIETATAIIQTYNRYYK